MRLFCSIICFTSLLFPSLGFTQSISLIDSDLIKTEQLTNFQNAQDSGLWDVLLHRAKTEPFNVVATLIFFCAILHTFFVKAFLKISHRFEESLRQDVASGKIKPSPEGKVSSFGATVFHFLGEVEAVFGIWAIMLFVAMCMWPGIGLAAATTYINDCNYTEPVFVVIIMAISATSPVVNFAGKLLEKIASLGKNTPGAWWLSILILAPIFGSFITEPAAMTIAALLLGKQFYSLKPSIKLCYATLGLLFVNISVGGTLTNFAAPPVLMVSATWGWSLSDMIVQFGWKAMTGIGISTLLFWWLFRREFAQLADRKAQLIKQNSVIHENAKIPFWVTLVHFGFILWTVVMLLEHRMVMFIAGFLFFLAFVTATARYQKPVELKSPLLVGFFLAGLVVHGGLQGWWIGPVLSNLSETALFLGSVGLTAFNDNAAITFLASQVSAFSSVDPLTGMPLVGDSLDGVKKLQYAILAGAVTGGGLTVIANAPNPAGQSLLSKYFEGGISPIWLFIYALIPTIILGLCFMLLP